jgi:hypothetical protein
MSKIRKSINSLKFIHVLTVVVAFMLASMFASAYRPTGSSTLSSSAEFSSSSRFAANYVFDRAFLWISMTPVQITTTDGLVSIGTGAGTYTEIGTSEAVALYLDTDADTVGTGVVPIPTDIDLAKDIQCRVIWAQSEAAGTGTIDFVLTYEIYVGGTTAVTVPNDAFDTDGGAQVDLGADILTLGPWSTIDGGTISATPGDDFWAFLLTYDETTAANAEVFGLQCRFFRKFLGGGQG